MSRWLCNVSDVVSPSNEEQTAVGKAGGVLDAGVVSAALVDVGEVSVIFSLQQSGNCVQSQDAKMTDKRSLHTKAVTSLRQDSWCRSGHNSFLPHLICCVVA